jgi:hypothetical protein
MQFSSAHTWVTLADGPDQFHDELVFGCLEHLSLQCLVICLPTDTVPVTGRLPADLPYSCCPGYNFLPKFFLISVPND